MKHCPRNRTAASLKEGEQEEEERQEIIQHGFNQLRWQCNIMYFIFNPFDDITYTLILSYNYITVWHIYHCVAYMVPQ